MEDSEQHGTDVSAATIRTIRGRFYTLIIINGSTATHLQVGKKGNRMNIVGIVDLRRHDAIIKTHDNGII